MFVMKLLPWYLWSWIWLEIYSVFYKDVCVLFFWIFYSNVVVLVKYDQLKEKKKDLAQGVRIRIDFICCSR